LYQIQNLKTFTIICF